MFYNRSVFFSCIVICFVKFFLFLNEKVIECGNEVFCLMYLVFNFFLLLIFLFKCSEYDFYILRKYI